MVRGTAAMALLVEILRFCPSVCLSVCLSACLTVCLCVCVCFYVLRHDSSTYAAVSLSPIHEELLIY